MDHALHRGQAYPGAAELLRAVQPLERTEQLVREAHVEAGAVVAHEEYAALAVAHGADLDPRMLDARRELPGIANQVVEHDAQQLRIGIGVQAIPDVGIDLAAG